MKRNFKWMLAAILTICGAINVYAQTGYTLTRISNPELGVGEVDGYIPGGDRTNNYTTSMTICGDIVYIATSRNLGSGWVNVFTPKCDFWGIFTDAIQGIYPRDNSNDGANIIAYNRKDGSFKVVYTAENAVYFNSAAAVGNTAFFGALSTDPLVKPYILKVKNGEEPIKVFETRDCNALRANCTYDGHLFFGGADEREDAPSNAAKLAVLRKSGGDDTAWNRVADYKDFGDVAYDEIFNVWSDSPIYDLASHNGYIYATIPTSDGFVIFRGHPAITGETANKYGWYWEEVAGKTNGKNNPALSEVAGGEPGTLTSLCGSLYEFNGKLYAYNFDHSTFGELSVFLGGLKSVTNDPTQPATAIDLLQFFYKTLKNPQKVWCLNDLTGEFELQEQFTQNMLGTLRGRMGDYDGQLYVTTLDPGHLYTLMSQVATSGLLEMTPSEIISKLTSLANSINILKKSKKQDTELIDKLELLQLFLSQFLVCDILNANNINEILSQLDLLNLNNLIKSLINNNEVTISTDYKNWLELIVKLLQDKIAGNTIEIPEINLPDLLTLEDYQKLLDEISKLIIDRLGGGTSTITPDYSALTELLNSLLANLGTDADANLKDLINSILEKLGGGTSAELNYTELLDLLKILFGGGTSTTPDYTSLLDLIQSLLNNSGTGDYSDLLDLIQSLLNGSSSSNTIVDLLKDLLIGGVLSNIWDNVQALINGFNTGVISDYTYLFNRMRANKMGSDLMRTSDGVNFEFVSRDGLGDKYNYGCGAFASDDKGLYIGTSNSFFGGQLWLLTSDGTPGSNWANDADAIQTITSAATQSGYYTLDGRRVNGKPAQKGIYIYNGKKIAVE